MIWLLVGALVPSFLVAWAAGFVARRNAAGWGLVDQPGHRKVHTQATPLGGGLAIWVAVVVPLAVGQLLLWILRRDESLAAALPKFIAVHLDGLAATSDALWFLMAAGTVLLILGLVDDRRGVDWRIRLAIQFMVAGLVVWRGWELTAFIEYRPVTFVLSTVWIVGLINTFNMLDNMDGLSAGVATIAASILAAVLLMAGDPESGGLAAQLFVGGFLLVLVGAMLGFLWHNRPPARLFMGDAGSYFIGFCLATATIRATFTGGDLPRHAILAPLCVLAVPLYDTVTVLWIRLREGRSPFVGDKSHFSHRLVELGMTKVQAVLTIYLATATCGLGAFLLHMVPSRVGAAIILLLVGCVLTLVAVLVSVGRRNHD